MACIPKAKIKEVLQGIKSLDGDILALSKMDIEKKAAFFKKYLGDDASSVANSLERALVSKRKRALGDWLKRNFDEKTIQANLNQAQKSAVEKYILNKVLPVSKESVVKTGKEVAMMPEAERLAFLKKHFTEDQVKTVERQIRIAEVIRKEQEAAAKVSAVEKKAQATLKREEAKLQNYIDTHLAGKQPKPKTKGITAKEVASMDDVKRLAYLKSIGVEDAAGMNERMTKAFLADEAAKAERAVLTAETRRVNSQEEIITGFIKRNLYSEGKGSTFHRKLNKPIDEILAMPEAERLTFLKGYVDDAADVNKKLKYASRNIFEKQIDADLKRLTNLDEMTAYADGKVSEILNAKNKIRLSESQTGKIMDFSREIEKLRIKSVDSGLFADRMAMNRKVLELQDYTETLLPKATRSENLLSVLGLTRMLQATGEMSAIGIQGFPHIIRYLNPNDQIWRIAKRAIKDGFSQKSYREHIAEYMSRDTAQARSKAKLMMTMGAKKLSDREEDFLTNIFRNMEKSKNPVAHTVGRIGEGFSRFHASYLSSLRVEHFDKVYLNLKKSGVKAGDDELEELGRVVNDFTGASRLGKLEDGNSVAIANQIFFSFRKVVSDIRKWSVRPIKDLYKVKTGTTAEKIIAKEGLKTFAGMVGSYSALSGLVALYKAGGGDAEVLTDQKSSKFGEVRIGDKTINIAGGSDWFPTLLARMAAGGQTDQLGIFRPYGTGFNEQTMGDTIAKTIRYKFSPNASLVVDFFAMRNAVGEKFFAGVTREELGKALDGDEGALALIKDGAQKEAFHRLVPIFWQALIEDPNTLQAFGALGFAQNPMYYGTDFEENEGKEISQFREKIGLEKTKEAEKKYNERVYDAVQAKKKEEGFLDKEPEDQMKEVLKIKASEKKKLFSEYGFVYVKD